MKYPTEKEIDKAKGIEAAGSAKAAAEKALLLAPVEAQTTLAKEIGSNDGYQKYLVTIEQVKAMRDVGMEQAKALDKATIKIIANTGSAPDGLKSVSDIFSSKGGTAIGAMLEGLANTDAGKGVMKTIGIDTGDKDAKESEVQEREENRKTQDRRPQR